ncbi:MAG: cardiolipin synthase [Bacteroidales bacterium]|nr:cardiolipin synthase [Fournierella massiliensis]MCF2556983.1 cardiolipin synthase [Fournierella massiliensis]MCI6739432.1 cardiolipin synthase [Bacteroidales bacterium]
MLFQYLKRAFLTRKSWVAVLSLTQIALTVALGIWLQQYAVYTYMAITAVSLIAVAILLDKDDVNPVYKLMWLLIILLLPPTGTIFYLYWGGRSRHGRKARQYSACSARANQALPDPLSSLALLPGDDVPFTRCGRYLAQYAYAPVWDNTSCRYYAWGQEFLPDYLEELQKAQQFIFLEYFILQEGKLWDQVLEILKQKAAQGVDVRVLYDGMGSLVKLPKDYDATLRSYGIQCGIFAPMRFSPNLSDYTLLNHRDHRKITVIDGNVAFSGGFNLADEYANFTHPHGVWKDTGFMLRGEAVYSYTAAFLATWDYVRHTVSPVERFRPTCRDMADCVIQPFVDSPLDQENVSENAYFNILQQAQRYVYVATPYLVVDNEMLTCLRLAAKSGVDVRILTPGIPDKKFVYLVTQSFYHTLLEAGVRIFEYTPGFMHAKMFVSDDKAAIVGSANMDYRSLYLHFENCCAFYGGQMVRTVRKDLEQCMAVSRECTLEEVYRTPLPKRILQIFFRIFAPLM